MMWTQTLVAGCLASVAVILAVAGTPPTGWAVRRRLVRLGVRRPARTTPATSTVPRPGGQLGVRHAAPRRPDLVQLGAALGGLATAVVLGGWSGLAVGAVVTIGLDRVLRRLEPAAARQQRLREAAELPLAADLLAAALRAGAPVDRAVAAVADALGGPLGQRLGRVGRTLLLGGGPEEAWAHLASVAGADRLIAAAVRSSASGSALAGALTRLADDLRADRATSAEAASRRAGVLIVLPLGLCFLPAFILAGLVPVIVAVLGDVL